MTPMTTERLVIRNFVSGDWEALCTLVVQYQSSEYAIYDQSWPTASEEIKRVVDWFAGGDSYLAVCLKDAGALIGFVALNREAQEDSRVFNVGYVFNQDYHGQGYATEACHAVLNYAFEQLSAAIVITGTAVVNQPSCRLLERLGFTRTAEATASFRQSEDGQPIEFLGCTYRLTRAEWNVM